MQVRFQCSSGHLLKTDGQYVGRRVRCPACGEQLTVPQAERTQFVTDTGVVRMLDEASGVYPEASVPSRPARPMFRCPRCYGSVEAGSRVCPHCSLYQVQSLQNWEEAVRSALRESIEVTRRKQPRRPPEQ